MNSLKARRYNVVVREEVLLAIEPWLCGVAWPWLRFPPGICHSPSLDDPTAIVAGTKL